MRPTPTRILRPNYITRGMLRANPDVLFAFGDNMQRRGFGGQAREMRGEPNAVGIPTKWAPHSGPAAYFTDDDWNREDVRCAIYAAFDQLAAALRSGGRIAISADGLGTGRAELATRAPRIARHIADRIAALEALVSIVAAASGASSSG
jgi:hypothetical protein